jgi:hypothetical protein
MTRTLQELAREALAVQDACNLSGVAQGFARAMADLCALVPGTDARNAHPIAVLWADKIAHLTGTQLVSGDEGVLLAAYREICSLIEERPGCRLCGKALNGDDLSGDPADSHQTCQQALEEGASADEVRARYE